MVNVLHNYDAMVKETQDEINKVQRRYDYIKNIGRENSMTGRMVKADLQQLHKALHQRKMKRKWDGIYMEENKVTKQHRKNVETAQDRIY